MFQPPTLRECLRAGLLGAAAAGAFSAALATAFVSSAPSISPALAATRAPAAPAGTTGPTITVSPTSGGPGTVVTVTGKGWVPPPAALGDAGAEIRYGNTLSSGQGAVSSKGTIHFTLKVNSSDRRGSNVVFAFELYNCGSTSPDGLCEIGATAQFKVT